MLFEQAPAGLSLIDTYTWNVEHGLIDDGSAPDNTYVAPDWATDPNSEFNNPAQFQVQTNLDDWFRAHNGGARFTVYNGVTIDNAAIAYQSMSSQVASGALSSLGTGLNADLDAEAAGAVAKASAAVAYGATHGGWTPATDPNAVPIVILNPTGVPVPPAINDTQLPPAISAPPLSLPPATLIPTAAQATAVSNTPLVVLGAALVVALVVWHF